MISISKFTKAQTFLFLDIIFNCYNLSSNLETQSNYFFDYIYRQWLIIGQINRIFLDYKFT